MNLFGLVFIIRNFILGKEIYDRVHLARIGHRYLGNLHSGLVVNTLHIDAWLPYKLYFD